MTVTAEQDLLDHLEPDETVEAVVFGRVAGRLEGESLYEDAVPKEKQGKVLSWEEARPLMRSWRFLGGYGSVDCHAVRIWTNRRVIWVTQYDGSTCLDSAPRNPVDHMPDMPGGG